MSSGYSLEEFAADKRLPVGFLKHEGLQDGRWRGKAAVAMSYRDEAGHTIAVRYRIARSGDRFRWRHGDRPKGLLFGLDRIKQLREAGWVLIVEGESDTLTAWLHDVPALGVPGAAMWADHAVQHLEGIKVYAWREPDQDGEVLVGAIKRSLPRAMVMSPPDGIKDLADAHCAGRDVRALIEEMRALAQPIADHDEEPKLPTIVTTARPLRDQTDDALRALQAANAPLRLFVRSRSLCRVVTDDDGHPAIETLSESALRGELARAADFVREVQRREGLRTIPTSPPLDVVRDVASLGVWPLPTLSGIVEAPSVRPDGTLLTSPGYDAATRTLYVPAEGLVVPAVPAHPTDENVRAAADLLQEVVADFPFDSQASRANCLAAMITPVLRPMIDGPVPLALRQAPGRNGRNPPCRDRLHHRHRPQRRHHGCASR